ncbi:FAD-binding protein [Amycolatopsis rhabdoformis]|uniref:FAD-binding protein n=1 Tax=Amycolatopsis rhabdoformis TaxID=1448059 RepID=A0ABZ1I113_9PSEU|nr:FAD-binding protein [Amycolatopsis rhabdoformis]WSE28064.1 FAD-binding protein [Amycolatopsis rhabdoformis]
MGGTGELAARVRGGVYFPGDPGYERERGGFNLSLDHRPDVVVAAGAEADVAEGVRFAAEHGLDVDVQATGHGAHRSMGGGLLVTTRGLRRVEVDPQQQVARVSAGATAADVLAATAAHGLTAPVGSAPGVGYVSYSLGGGLGMLGRRHGYAADHVRSLDVVTADGGKLTVTADHHPDLFRALRGGGGNFAAVTALEVGLVPADPLYGGGLFFTADHAPAVIERFHHSVGTAPRELSLSLAFLAFPDVPAVPEPLRGRFCCHLRVAYFGDADVGRRLVEPLAAAGPFLDTVGPLPMTELGSIHADPVGPMPVASESLALSSEDALEVMPSLVDPSAPFMLELRHLGGALSEQTAIPDAVGHRAARLNLFTSTHPGADPTAQQRVYPAVAAWSSGGPLRTFLPTSHADASACYEPEKAAELARLKEVWDPGDVFSFAPAVVAPAPRASRTSGSPSAAAPSAARAHSPLPPP